ncbi:MAG: kinase [Gammaproteobacteria bacterium]|jgi:mevalonate kinase|nr:kinase [Gammaproteobacteria bacterium]
MACDWIKARAPGSVMLFGEHAVLAGEAAMVAALDQYITLTVEKRVDDAIEISSNLYPPYTTHLKELTITEPYTFVLACLMQQKQKITRGLTIRIDSDINPTLGLGSSAAITVALLSALDMLFQIKMDVWLQARDIIRNLQGRGSGMDALASLHGGALYHSPKTEQILTLAPRSDLHLLYCGYKTATATVLQRVQNTFTRAEGVLDSIYHAIGETVQLACQAWQNDDTALLAKCMDIHQGLQQALQVSDQHCDHLRFWLKERVAVEAVKISGSGLGDCLLALGGQWQEISADEITALHPKARYMPLTMSTTGVSLVQ